MDNVDSEVRGHEGYDNSYIEYKVGVVERLKAEMAAETQIGRGRETTASVELSNLMDLLPRKLILFDDIEVKRIASSSYEDFTLEREKIRNEIKFNLSTLFTLKGEISGHLLAVTTDESFNRAVCSDVDEKFKSLFVETVNVLAGNFLTEIDREQKLFSYFLPPLIFVPSRDEHFIKNNKMTFLLEKDITSFLSIFKLEYSILYKESLYHFYVLVLINK